jgi:hypothetical protein
LRSYSFGFRSRFLHGSSSACLPLLLEPHALRALGLLFGLRCSAGGLLGLHLCSIVS